MVGVRGEDFDRLALTVARIALATPVIVIEPDDLADVLKRIADHLTTPSTSTSGD